MTERLYYRDSFLREFEAEVLSCEAARPETRPAAEDARWHVVLDRTVFYPTSVGKGGGTKELAQGSVPEGGALEGLLNRTLTRLRD